MTDTLEREPAAKVSAENPGRTRIARERARGEIRTALARLGAIDEARTALELIAESALRYGADAGPKGYRVVDEQGQTRLREGGSAEFTIDDLVAELRRKHPTLFTAATEVSPAPSQAEKAEPEQVQPGPPLRDWLLVAPGAPAPSDAAQPAVTARMTEVLQGRADVARGVLRATFQRASAGARAGIEGLRGAALRASPALQRMHLPRPRLRAGYAAAAAAAALVVLGAGFVLGTALNPRGAKEEPQRAAGLAQKPEARAVPPATPVEAPAPAPSSPSAAPEPRATASVGPPPARGPLAGVPEVIDTATLRIEGKIVRLFGVEWARGAQGEDLKRYLGTNDVRCTPTGGTDLYRCEVDGKDISEVVLYNGGGRATSDAPADLLAAEIHAKTEKIGVWKK